MIQLVQTNRSGVKLPGGNFEDLLKKSLRVLRAAGVIAGESGRDGILELYFVDEDEIKELNKKFRGKDAVTDVLSFSYLEAEEFPRANLIGQIFIAPMIAKGQAAEHGLMLGEELEFLFVHGVLHVYGMDHEKAEDFRVMYGLQAKIMPDCKWGSFVEKIYQQYFGAD